MGLKEVEEIIKKNLSNFFKGNIYLNIELKKYIMLKDSTLDEIMLKPCEIAFYKESEQKEELNTLNTKCSNTKEWTSEDFKDYKINKCEIPSCNFITSTHDEKMENNTIITYKKVANKSDLYYKVSFSLEYSLDEEQKNFYKFFITNILEMLQLNSYYKFENNIFFEAFDEYKILISKAFLNNYLKEYLDIDISQKQMENIHKIVATPYEKSQSCGWIIITNSKELKKLKFFINLKNKIKINDTKQIRKLLEISNLKDKKLALIMTEKGYSGFITEDKINEINKKIEIVIKNNHEYEYKSHQYSYKIKNNYIYFEPVIKRQNFPECEELLEKAKYQKKGTIIVIIKKEFMDKPSTKEKIIKPILNTGFSITQFELEKDYLLNISSIDGAILLDNKKNCYGIGIILDGNSEVESDPARGARYNSALRFHKKLCDEKITHLIQVVSEDGDINIFDYTNENIEKIQEIIQNIREYSNKEEWEKIIENYSKNKTIFEEVKTEFIAPELGNIYNLIGYSYLEKGENTEATTAYKNAIELGFKNRTIYNNLAISYERQNKLDDASIYYFKCLNLEVSLTDIIINNIILFLNKNINNENYINKIKNSKITSENLNKIITKINESHQDKKELLNILKKEKLKD